MVLLSLLALALLSFVSWIFISPRATRLRSRVLLWIALAPGNGGMPRPRAWRAARDLARRAEVLEAVARDRRRLRRALAAMASAPPAIAEPPAWPAGRVPVLAFGTPGPAKARPWRWERPARSSVSRG